MGWPPIDTGITDQHDRLPFPRRLIDQPCQYLNFTLPADKSHMRLLVDEFGLSIGPGLGQSMNLAVGFSTSTSVGRPGSCRPRPPKRHRHEAWGRSTRSCRERSRSAAGALRQGQSVEFGQALLAAVSLSALMCRAHYSWRSQGFVGGVARGRSN